MWVICDCNGSPKPSSAVFATMLLLVFHVPTLAQSYEFGFESTGRYSYYSTACITFRASDASPWGYMSTLEITPRSAGALCHAFDPSSQTGTIDRRDRGCRKHNGGVYQYSTNIDCPDKDAPPTSGNCNVTGNMVPDLPTATFYGVGIRCIRSPRWGYYSTFSPDAASLVPIAQGSSINDNGTRNMITVSISPLVDINGIRPDYYFSYGTVCLPPLRSTLNVVAGDGLAKALCQTVGLQGSANSTVIDSRKSSASYHKYISDIKCTNDSSPSETAATLFNGGCSFTPHFYDALTATECSSFLPQVSCPTSFDIKLEDPIESTGIDGGFQLVQLRPHHLDNVAVDVLYDGVLCMRGYTTNFANAMCNMMYGADNIDFATAHDSNEIQLPSTTRDYLSDLVCASDTSTNFSHCTAKVTPNSPSRNHPCNGYRGLVSCKLNEYNTIFSMAPMINACNTIISPGKGYLMASAVGNAPASVCCNTNDFNIITARAACRSIGYTPGANVSFTVAATATTSHAINNVSCPTDAHKLTDCKLQYSGIGSKLPSSAVRDVCGGGVHLDCDLGSPKVEFRMDTRRYLQARLYSNSEWGRVVVGDDVTSRDGYYAMCAHQTSTSGDIYIFKSFLYVSSCPPSATSLSDCKYEFTNGASARGKTRFYCSKNFDDKSSGSASGLGLGAIIGLGAGIPAIAIILLFLADKAWSKKKKRGNQVNTEHGEMDEEATAEAARRRHFVVSVEGINSEELMAMEAEFPGEHTDEQ